jgi:hypothetical protein
VNSKEQLHSAESSQNSSAPPVKYAHTVYEEPDNLGRYHQAYAWVGTLEQIAEQNAAASTLPYQFEFFGGQDVVTLEDKQLSITSGNGLFEVFDLEQVTQAIPELTVVYAIDDCEFSAEEKKKIQQRTYTQEDEHLWDAHEVLEEKQVGELGVIALVRGLIPYREDLIRSFLEDNALLGETNFPQQHTYTLEKLGEHGQPVFDESLLAPGAQCWIHDLEDEPLSFVDYWTAIT